MRSNLLAPTHRARRNPFGRSVHDVPAAIAAAVEGASWLVLGTIYPTPSKPGHPGVGPALIERVVQRVAPLPVFAIGGIVPARISELLRAGAHGVAVSGAILGARDVERATGAFTRALARTGAD